MTVKGIFKTLLGLTVSIVMISLCTELFNMMITGYQIRQMIKMSARQAAELFTQETYRTDKITGYSINMPSIRYDSNGDNKIDTSDSIYIDGTFYKYNNKEAEWKEIYTSKNYKKFTELEKTGTSNHFYVPVKLEDSAGSGTPYCDYYFDNKGSAKGIHNYEDDTLNGTKLRDIYSIVNQSYLYTHNSISELKNKINNTTTSLTSGGWGESLDETNKIRKINLYSAAVNAYETNHSAINSGIPYLDANITSKMFRWNLAKILSNNDDALIQVDNATLENKGTNIKVITNSEPFVNYKGFKVYANKAYINKYNYRVYDTSIASDANELAYLTNFNYSRTDSEAIRINDGQEEGTGENNFVAIVAISYNVPVTYVGVTPIRRIMNWAWNREVKGFKTKGSSDTANITNQGTNRNTFDRPGSTWHQNTQNMNSADFYAKMNSDFDALFTQGYLWYYIVH